MKTNFNKCCDLLLKDEGGYSNDPDDNGGATNFGITIADYKRYLNKNGTPNDVKNMKVSDARAIYKSKYWDALGCDTLSNGVDYTVFDYGVNSGLKRPKDDLVKFKDLSGIKLIDAINDERQAFLTRIGVGHNAKFLKGWTNRVSRVRSYSKSLATDKVSGPIAAAPVTLGFWGLTQQYWHAHPYLMTGAAIGVAALVWYVVHTIRNKNAVA